jgi:hypothetical protein
MTTRDASRNLPLWGLSITYRYMWVSILGACAIGAILLGMPTLGVNAGMLSVTWLGVVSVGVSALIVFREQSKRIQRLEEQVAQLRDQRAGWSV